MRGFFILIQNFKKFIQILFKNRIIVNLPHNVIINIMKPIIFIFLWLFGFTGFAQQTIPADSLYKPDPHYLEDQLYFGISYIVLKNLPEQMTQNGFSNKVKLGFIRDIPLNEQRNFGIGIGLGLSWDTYFQNLRVNIDEQTGEVSYAILENVYYRSNSFSLNKIDIPFEFRYRGSTPKKYKFWRLYAGVTTSYVYKTHANYVTKKVDITYQNIKIINNWQYGINISAGYGIWNFNFYYGLNDLIKKSIKLDGKDINVRTMSFGIIYYFL